MNNVEQLKEYREAHLKLMKEQVEFLKLCVESNNVNLVLLREVAYHLSGMRLSLEHATKVEEAKKQPKRRKTMGLMKPKKSARLAQKAKITYK